jgi:Ca2+/Na+ antiporter
MVLIIPWFLSIVGGRVNIDPKTKQPRYKSPKLTPPDLFHLTSTGVGITREVSLASRTMILTCLSYLLLQVPGLVYLHSTPAEQAAGERNWAFIGLLTCISFFAYYLYQQYVTSNVDKVQQLNRDEYVLKSIKAKTVSLAGVMTAELVKFEESGDVKTRNGPAHTKSSPSYQGTSTELAPLTISDTIEFSDQFIDHLKRILRQFFINYDITGAGHLKTKDLLAVFRDLGESLTSEQLQSIFAEFDTDGNGVIDFDEFVKGTAKYIYSNKEMMARYQEARTPYRRDKTVENVRLEDGAEDTTGEEEEEEEEEEMPDDIKMLSPEEQQIQIKRRAFWMMAVGSIIVLLISDPMVDVLSEVGNRTGIPAFYVAFIVAPLASNLTELIAAYNYSLKKTQTSITVSLTTLEGAAIMNNTFVLGK